MSATDASPSLEVVINAAVKNARRDMFGGWLPGRIHAYDAAKKKATVRIDVLDGDEEYPLIEDVPVVFPGSGKVRVKWPVSVGDSCVVMFASRSIDRWLPAGARLDPGTERDHDMSDACVIPGLLDFGHANDGEALIEFTTDDKIRCGGDQPLVTREEFLNHGHATAGTGAPSAPITVTPPGSSITFPGTSKLRG